MSYFFKQILVLTLICFFHVNSFAQTLNRVERLAEDGNSQAQYVLGMRYLNGREVAQNDALAVQWLTKSAEAGLADAQFYLSILYVRGRGVPLDQKSSFEWAQKAAVQGHLEANYSMGVYYDLAMGTEADKTKSLEHHQFAADQGHSDAQYTIGLSHIVKNNNAEARKWFRRAAIQDHPEAQKNLGFLYMSGQGGVVDKNETRNWLEKAAEQGNKLAIDALKKLN